MMIRRRPPRCGSLLAGNVRFHLAVGSGLDPLEIFNTLGEKVYTEKIYSSQNFIKWQPKKIGKGIYIITLTENNKPIGNKKIIYN